MEKLLQTKEVLLSKVLFQQIIIFHTILKRHIIVCNKYSLLYTIVKDKMSNQITKCTCVYL